MMKFIKILGILSYLLQWNHISWACNLESLHLIRVDVEQKKQAIQKRNFNYNYLSELKQRMINHQRLLGECIAKSKKNIINVKDILKNHRESLSEKDVYLEIQKKNEENIRESNEILMNTKRLMVIIEDKRTLAKDFVNRKIQKKPFQQLLHEKNIVWPKLKPKKVIFPFLAQINTLNSYFFIESFLLLTVIGFFCFTRIRTLFNKKPSSLKTLFWDNTKYSIIFMIPVGSFFAYFQWITRHWLEPTPGLMLNRSWLMLLFVKILSLMYLCFFMKGKSHQFYQEVLKHIKYLMNILYVIGLFQFVIIYLLAESNIMQWIYLILIVPVLSLSFLYFSTKLILILTTPNYFPNTSKMTRLLWRYGFIFLISLYFIIRECVAYQGHLVFSTIEVVLSFMLVIYFLKYLSFQNHIALYLTRPQEKIWLKFKALFGAGRNDSLIEINFLMILIELFLFYGLLILILTILTVPNYYIYLTQTFIFHSFKIDSLDFSVLNIIKSFSIFFSITLLGKYIAHRISNLPSYKHDFDKKNTINLCIQFLFYLLATIMYVLALGLSSSHISIILGGLSFAVGIGLQFILKDFVSGIIVITKKTIHIGDFIEIKGIRNVNISTVGKVQSISTLSTQILNEDQILINVPNSYILENCVLNFTISGLITTCYINFKLKYLADYSLCVNDISQILNEYPEVIQTQGQAPSINIQLPSSSNPKDSMMIHINFLLKNIDNKQFLYHEIEKKIHQKLKLKKVIYDENM